MVRFSTLSSTGEETEVREIATSDIRACPHYILVPNHYSLDGRCDCNDPTAKYMKKWGYRWKKESKRWE